MVTKVKGGVLDESALSGKNMTGDIAFDTTTLKIDASNNRVGIGTASPTSPLTVSGADGTLALFTNASDADFAFKTASGVALITPSTGTLAFGTSNTERWRIDSSGHFTGVSGSKIVQTIASGGGNFLEVTHSGNEAWSLAVQSGTGADDYLDIGINGGTRAISIHEDGKVGIGTTSPTGKLEIAVTGTNAAPHIKLVEDSDTREFNIYNDGSGNGHLVLADSDDDTPDTEIVLNDNGIITMLTGNSERMRINSSGNLLIGTTTDVGVAGGGIRLTYPTSESDGDVYFSANGGGSNANPFVLKVVSQNLYDSGVAAMYVGRHSGNSRSINAGGTVNASGADYAEYMKKADSCGTIAKGDVCGVDSTGKLTDVFNNAISFVIKSTDPSYVGGDTWGSVDLNLTDEEYETERQKHDRIAFSGQVPVNITGSFNVGDYVYPQANGTSIQCVAKSNPTFEEYKLCVGKIWATQSDGKPLVAVKIG